MILFKKYEIAGRTIATVAAIVALMFLAAMVPSCVSKWRADRAQHKVDNAQSGAFQNSASDAVNTQSEANAREADSEATTRSNERTIRDAPGSTDAVNPAVRDAGFASLCKRASFRNSPTGRLRCPSPARVEKGR